MMTATVFLILLTGHLLGDWVAQSDWQATNKTRSWAALAAHVAGYHLVMGLLLLVPVVRDGWPAGKALAVLVVSAARRTPHGHVNSRPVATRWAWPDSGRRAGVDSSRISSSACSSVAWATTRQGRPSSPERAQPAPGVTRPVS